MFEVDTCQRKSRALSSNGLDGNWSCSTSTLRETSDVQDDKVPNSVVALGKKV